MAAVLMAMDGVSDRQRLLNEIRNDLRTEFPSLHLFAFDGKCEVAGRFPIRSPDGKTLDEYDVKIELPEGYPHTLPIVRETGGRIPREKEFHVDANGVACVLMPEDRWRCFPVDAPFIEYLRGPLYNFFLGQSLVALGESWPFGEWPHENKGVYAFYSQLLGVTSVDIIIRFVTVLANRPIAGCPCGSGGRLKDCCYSRVSELRKKISPEMAAASLIRLQEYRAFRDAMVHVSFGRQNSLTTRPEGG